MVFKVNFVTFNLDFNSNYNQSAASFITVPNLLYTRIFWTKLYPCSLPPAHANSDVNFRFLAQVVLSKHPTFELFSFRTSPLRASSFPTVASVESLKRAKCFRTKTTDR
ncbi:hypothetical protein L596_002571 [Steinernema carpocapsae]|uniref:Uncharacterized protein n=1 Tax=Steinernema carpocapsae TaxID=34508 RepID=A0A4U8URG5_STECR|nr:hypothetical protein L596_002571 [Steinernema carpocapsae]